MEKPFRYRKKLLKSGSSNYVIIPADWEALKGDEVILEVYKDKIIILPIKK